MNLSNLDHKDVWARAGKTAVQAAVAAALLAPEPVTTTGIVAIGAAVVSAVWNYLIQIVKPPVKLEPQTNG